ncbi:hypothetical protein SAMN03097699_0332 [Flavobacteriaceae bacterium MAR_2010_188]|nr:hypothetical protein SAMN03097699_0332 [Flavobacteriaceae bacterium MAR_2010_188]
MANTSVVTGASSDVVAASARISATGSTVTVTVVVSVVVVPSALVTVTVYSYVSVPLKSGFGVYVIDPSASIVVVPFAGSVAFVTS